MKEQSVTEQAQQIPPECVVRVPPWAWFLLSLLAGMGLQRIVPLEFPALPASSMIGWVVVAMGMVRHLG